MTRADLTTRINELLETHDHTSPDMEEYTVSPIITKEIQFLTRKLLNTLSPSPEGFTGEFYQN